MAHTRACYYKKIINEGVVRYNLAQNNSVSLIPQQTVHSFVIKEWHAMSLIGLSTFNV